MHTHIIEGQWIRAYDTFHPILKQDTLQSSLHHRKITHTHSVSLTSHSRVGLVWQTFHTDPSMYKISFLLPQTHNKAVDTMHWCFYHTCTCFLKPYLVFFLQKYRFIPNTSTKKKLWAYSEELRKICLWGTIRWTSKNMLSKSLTRIIIKTLLWSIPS